jgi:serine/threonine-protein kinase SRPK3
MFDGRVPPDGHYEVRQHLAEIVDLFGPFPKTLLERGNKKTVEDLFDDDGQVKGAMSNRPPLVDEIWLGGLSEEARLEFASFLQLMMKIDPAERPSTVDLPRHPWMGLIVVE